MKISVKVVLFFLITFIFGITIGYFLNKPVSKILRFADRVEMHDYESQDREHREMRMRDYMVKELELRDDQTEFFFETMRNSRRTMRVIMTQSRDESILKIRAESDSLNVVLAEILSQDQLQKWDKMRERYLRLRDQNNESGPGPRP